jgi:serine/threonine-protein kinase
MAPEQATGRPVSPATDIYALGAVAFCCLTGNPPFTGDNPLKVALKHLEEEPPPLPADVPAPLAALVSRALAKQPEERFPDAAAFAAEARALLPSAGTAPIESTAPALPAAPLPVGGPTRPPLRPGAASGAAPRPGMVAAGGNGSVGPSTLSDMPRVSPSGRRRGAALVGAAVTVVIAVAGLATVLAFTRDEPPTPRSTPTASSTSAPATTGDPLAPGDGNTSQPGWDGNGPSGSTRKPTATPSHRASATGEPDASASATPPTGETQKPTDPAAEPTEPAKTDSPAPDSARQG